MIRSSSSRSAANAPVGTPSAPLPTAKPNATAADPLANAQALMVEGQVTKACAAGERAKGSSPEVAEIYRFLGQCYMRLGRAAEARSNYINYLKARPDAPDAAFIRGILD